ncbi:hypothetical protein O6R05_07135 [Peptoniphilus equinus]|uniref:ATPase n=1 Tax=Peptoniphilus equinus TaxID=3016343 RepID=A0ABY7QU07_9FIRM|nr:hypothetical protein [Peptoniphilus equinus]WBW49770.1 hypothetical protein O6R05_07135 [Peptoniphilus equinus]
MEDLIERVLSLDKKTTELVQKSEAELESAKGDIQEILNNFEFTSHEKAKQAAMEAYNTILENARDEVRRIVRDNEARLNHVESIYMSHKDELLDQAIDLLELK